MLICVTQLFKFIDYEELKVYIFHWPNAKIFKNFKKRKIIIIIIIFYNLF